MSPHIATIPRFLLPQLSWKTSLPLALASRIRPPIKGPAPALAPWNKPIHCSIASTARRCRHNGRALSPLVSYRQGPPLATYFHIASNTGKCFSTTPTLSRDHHFDTLKFVQRLKDEGFSEEQSKAMMLVLSDVIEESIQNLTRTMVLREGLPSLQFKAPAHPPLTLLLQTPIEVPTHKRLTSRNFAPNFWPLTPATRP